MKESTTSRVAFERRAIWIDGVETRILAGTMHFFRQPREYWRERMEKAAAMGLNAIETYLCWNLHERREGVFDFSGNLDFEAYFRLAQELGLFVIARPGPYICSEWDNGGFPSWLMRKPGIRYRRMNGPYIEAVDKYLDVVIPKLRELQYDRGGPIIAMQIENEYGAYSCDKAYLAHLRDRYRDGGITIPLFTADNPDDLAIPGGTIDGASLCLNFGSRSYQAFSLGRKYRPDDPPVCTEFWCGWFDHWEGGHHVRTAANAAGELDDMLEQGASVVFYPFCGGTTFGLLAGANGTGDPPVKYIPDVSSYDFDAPLSEAGVETEKYRAFRDVILKHGFGGPAARAAAANPPQKKAFLAPREVPLTGVAPLLGAGGCLDAVADAHVSATTPPTMEELGQDFGYVYYRTHVRGPGDGPFALRQVHDRANVYLDGRLIAVYYRNDKSSETPQVSIPAEGAELGLLVENMGRINYGRMLGFDSKGICEDVAFKWQILVDWEAWSLTLDNPDGRFAFAPFEAVLIDKPAFYLAEFDVDAPADAWLEFPGVHGAAWLNGHPLGRYWEVGPAKTLYLPGCWMRKGTNRLVVFETERLLRGRLRLVDKPDLGPPTLKD